MPKVNAAYEQARRQHIVEAAARCFTRSGYDATTVEDVCHEAGLSKGGLYTYFKSKEQLFAAVCQGHWLEGFQQAAEQLAAQPTVEAKLDALGEAAFGRLNGRDDSLAELSRMSLAVWNEAARNADTRELVMAGYSAWGEQLEALLVAGQESGEIDPSFDPHMLAVALIGAFDGLQVYAAVCGEPIDLDLFQQTFMQLVKGGILCKH